MTIPLSPEISLSPSSFSGSGSYDELVAENEKLKDAIRAAIPWIGSHSEGPSWATSAAKIRNAEMCDDAMNQAIQALGDD